LNYNYIFLNNKKEKFLLLRLLFLCCWRHQ